MTPELLAEKIGLAENAKAAALAFEITAEEESRLRDAFDRDYKEFEELVSAKDDPNMWVLALYLRWAADSFKLYRGNGIPDEITVDTFRDIALWSERYFARTGRIGLIEWHWHPIHIKMKIFRLGRLQFEPVLLKEDTPLAPKGTPVLSIHIPRGDSISPEKVRLSLEMSKEFFPKHFGARYDLYYCNSWLLAPELDGMISPDSSIAGFRRYFTVYGSDLSYSQAEDYVFLQKLDDPKDYPEDTTLQRNLKKFLLDGGKMGMGRGVFKY